MMREGTKSDTNLNIGHDDLLNEKDFESKNNIPGILEALSQKIKILESIEATAKTSQRDNCNFKNSCYVAKSKMGSCPCELYR